MKKYSILSILALLLLPAIANAQQAHEYSPLVEKTVNYKDWTLPNLTSDEPQNLRKLMAGKKLVMIVYFAPWCPNWRHDLEFVKSLHDKYAASGLGIIAVGEYDPVDKMKNHLDQYKLAFPSVYESDNQTARLTSNHYLLRTEAGDKRKWGTPWYVLLDPATLSPSGDVLTEKTTLVNGELIKPDAEKYIRAKLGLDG